MAVVPETTSSSVAESVVSTTRAYRRFTKPQGGGLRGAQHGTIG